MPVAILKRLCVGFLQGLHKIQVVNFLIVKFYWLTKWKVGTGEVSFVFSGGKYLCKSTSLSLKPCACSTISIYYLQLQLPEMTEETHWLTFSLVEKYFYRKQQEMCRTEATKVDKLDQICTCVSIVVILRSQWITVTPVTSCFPCIGI